MLLLPLCTPTASGTGHSKVLSELLFLASLPTPVKQSWYSTALSTYTRAKEFKGSQNCKEICMPLHHCPAPWAPSPLSLPSAAPLTPKSLSQSVGDRYLSFWTHFSSAFPEAMWIFLLLNPTPTKTSGFGYFCLLFASSLQTPSQDLKWVFSPQYGDGGMVQEEKSVWCQTKQAVHKGDGAVTPLLPLPSLLPVKQQLPGTITGTITK